MGITVGHSPSAEIVGDAAFNVGRGEKNRYDQEQRLKVDMFNAQMRERDTDRNVDLYKWGENNKIAQAEEGRRQQSTDRMNKYYDALSAKMDRYDPVELERERQQGRLQELALRNPDFGDTIAMRTSLNNMTRPQYTSAQQRRLDEIDGMREWVGQKVQNGEWAPEWGAQVLEQAEMARMGIKPTKTNSRDGFDAEEEFQNNVTVDPFTGERWLNNNGKWENITPKSKKEEPTVMEQAKAKSELLGHFLKYVEMRRTEVQMNAGEDEAVKYPTMDELRMEFKALTEGNPEETEQPAPEAAVAEPPSQPQPGQPTAAAPQEQKIPMGYELLAPKSVIETLKKNPGDYAQNPQYFNQKIAEYVQSQNPKMTDAEFAAKLTETAQDVLQVSPATSEAQQDKVQPSQPKNNGVKQEKEKPIGPTAIRSELLDRMPKEGDVDPLDAEYDAQIAEAVDKAVKNYDGHVRLGAKTGYAVNQSTMKGIKDALDKEIAWIEQKRAARKNRKVLAKSMGLNRR